MSYIVKPTSIRSIKKKIKNTANKVKSNKKAEIYLY